MDNKMLYSKYLLNNIRTQCIAAPCVARRVGSSYSRLLCLGLAKHRIYSDGHSISIANSPTFNLAGTFEDLAKAIQAAMAERGYVPPWLRG
jgi:hypothetical protein